MGQVCPYGISNIHLLALGLLFLKGDHWCGWSMRKTMDVRILSIGEWAPPMVLPANRVLLLFSSNGDSRFLTTLSLQMRHSQVGMQMQMETDSRMGRSMRS